MGLLDAAQAASNAAASTVSGPVDMLAWLLRKAGVDVGEPVGGSDWMKRKGLTKDVAPGASQVVGETLGLLAPTAVATKAPQIAKGLLAAADNLAAPRTLNPQQGAINVEALRAQFPDIDFWLSQRGNIASLDRVVVPDGMRNQGRGSEFMAALTKAADEDAARLGLSPSSDFGGSKVRLEEFYRRFGFVPNKGRNRDFELMSSMIRQPASTR